MPNTFVAWTSAFITARAESYQNDHRRLAEDAVRFADEMNRATRERFALPPPKNLLNEIDVKQPSDG